jgi:hypothetical protein
MITTLIMKPRSGLRGACPVFELPETLRNQ